MQDASGCSAPSDTVTVTANPLPAVNAGIDKTIYLGYGSQSVSLTATASGEKSPYTYSWSTGQTTASITVSPTTATNYVVTVTDANGCSASDEVRVNVIDVRCCKDEKEKDKDKNEHKEKEKCKVLVCHKEGEKKEKEKEKNKNKDKELEYKTICVDSHAVAAHLAHGDELGNCIKNESKKAQDAPLAKDTVNKQQIITNQSSKEIQFESYPNPFSDKTMIQFSIPEKSGIKLELYNIAGKQIETIFEGNVEGNKVYTIEYSAKNLSAGMYFYKLSSNVSIWNKKVVVIK